MGQYTGNVHCAATGAAPDGNLIWSDEFDGESVFHNDFFFLLNVAVGGDWPGFNIDDSRLPVEMLVDYIRVYAPGDDLVSAAKRCGVWCLRTALDGLKWVQAAFGKVGVTNVLRRGEFCS